MMPKPIWHRVLFCAALALGGAWVVYLWLHAGSNEAFYAGLLVAYFGSQIAKELRDMKQEAIDHLDELRDAEDDEPGEDLSPNQLANLAILQAREDEVHGITCENHLGQDCTNKRRQRENRGLPNLMPW